MLSGIRCKVCGMAKENNKFALDNHDNPLYFNDPKISKVSQDYETFCGPVCSTNWHLEKMKAETPEDVTPKT